VQAYYGCAKRGRAGKMGVQKFPLENAASKILLLYPAYD
jgi:hypothetical protein